jgi:hypothetical protein
LGQEAIPRRRGLTPAGASAIDIKSLTNQIKNIRARGWLPPQSTCAMSESGAGTMILTLLIQRDPFIDA